MRTKRLRTLLDRLSDALAIVRRRSPVAEEAFDIKPIIAPHSLKIGDAYYPDWHAWDAYCSTERGMKSLLACRGDRRYTWHA